LGIKTWLEWQQAREFARAQAATPEEPHSRSTDLSAIA
jgi:hypothetical protein